MNTIVRPKADLAVLSETEKQLHHAAETATTKLDDLAWRAGEILGGSEKAEEWQERIKTNWDVHSVIRDLLGQVAPAKLKAFEHAADRRDDLTAATESFSAFCETLEGSRSWSDKKEIDPDTAGKDYEARSKLLEQTLKASRALTAADSPRAKVLRPQLDDILQTLRRDLRTLKSTAQAAVGEPAPAKVNLDYGSAVQQLSTVLKQSKLAQRLDAVRETLSGARREAFDGNVVAFARLASEATEAPDYAKVGMGWNHPDSRKDYRARAHGLWSNFRSKSRQRQSQQTLTSALNAALDNNNPARALESAVVSSFLREIGAEHTARWKPTAAGVRKALSHEALLPLRALNETQRSMSKGDYGLLEPIEQVVNNITQSMVEGRFKEWRTASPTSTKQLQVLSDKQRELFLGKLSIESTSAEPGQVLRTREEDDVELLWVTKIGGPSHGFDYGGQCLLPLLANARTRAIMIDDPRWSHNAAARGYLRILEDEQGEPIMYLEPVQRDFPHREKYKGWQENGVFAAALVRHAVAKADQMGVRLSIDKDWGWLAEELGIEVDSRADRYLLRASGGVNEASDTLGAQEFGMGKHDWAQMADELTIPIRRLVYHPKK